jgi:hypothetical protein
MRVIFGTSGNGRSEDLLWDADIAMYQAKNRGKAHLPGFDLNMDFYARERLGLDGDL